MTPPGPASCFLFISTDDQHFSSVGRLGSVANTLSNFWPGTNRRGTPHLSISSPLNLWSPPEACHWKRWIRRRRKRYIVDTLQWWMQLVPLLFNFHGIPETGRSFIASTHQESFHTFWPPSPPRPPAPPPSTCLKPDFNLILPQRLNGTSEGGRLSRLDGGVIPLISLIARQTVKPATNKNFQCHSTPPNIRSH